MRNIPPCEFGTVYDLNPGDDGLRRLLAASATLTAEFRVTELIRHARALRPAGPGVCAEYGRGMAELILSVSGLDREYLPDVARAIGMSEAQITRLW